MRRLEVLRQIRLFCWVRLCHFLVAHRRLVEPMALQNNFQEFGKMLVLLSMHIGTLPK